MIDYMRFDVMWMDEVIASVDLKPVNGGTPYVVNYINDFNKQFSPNMEGHITLEELDKCLVIEYKKILLQEKEKMKNNTIPEEHITKNNI